MQSAGADAPALRALAQPRAAFQTIMRSLADLGNLLEQRGVNREADSAVSGLIASLRSAKDVVERMPDPTSYYDGKHAAASDFTKYRGNLLFGAELGDAAGRSVEASGGERVRQHVQKPAQPLLQYILRELDKISDAQLQVTARKAFLIHQNDGIVDLLWKMSRGEEPAPKLDFFQEPEVVQREELGGGGRGTLAMGGGAASVTAESLADGFPVAKADPAAQDSAVLPDAAGAANTAGGMAVAGASDSVPATAPTPRKLAASGNSVSQYEQRYRSIAGKLAARLELSRTVKLSLPQGRLYPLHPMLTPEEYLDTILHSIPHSEKEVERNPLWGNQAIYLGMCLVLLQRAGGAPAFMSLFGPGRHALCPFGIRPYSVPSRTLPACIVKLRYALSEATRRTYRDDSRRRYVVSTMRQYLWSSVSAFRGLQAEYLQAFAKQAIFPFIEVLGPLPSDYVAQGPAGSAESSAVVPAVPSVAISGSPACFESPSPSQLPLPSAVAPEAAAPEDSGDAQRDAGPAVGVAGLAEAAEAARGHNGVESPDAPEVREEIAGQKRFGAATEADTDTAAVTAAAASDAAASSPAPASPNVPAEKSSSTGQETAPCADPQPSTDTSAHCIPPPALGLSLQAAGFRDILPGPQDAQSAQGLQEPQEQQPPISFVSGPGKQLLRHLSEVLPSCQLSGAELWRVMRCGDEEVLLLDMQDGEGLVVFGFHYFVDAQ